MYGEVFKYVTAELPGGKTRLAHPIKIYKNLPSSPIKLDFFPNIFANVPVDRIYFYSVLP